MKKKIWLIPIGILVVLIVFYFLIPIKKFVYTECKDSPTRDKFHFIKGELNSYRKKTTTVDTDPSSDTINGKVIQLGVCYSDVESSVELYL